MGEYSIMFKKNITFLSLIIILSCLMGCTANTKNKTLYTSNMPDTSIYAVQMERVGFEGGNIGAMGLVCGGNDGYVYYRSESDGWKLYKAKPDGSSKTKISNNVVEKINVLDGWIYYIDHLDNNSINKVRTDGTEETKLMEGYCSNLYVAESGIYFDKRDKNNIPQIYQADLNGGNLRLLVPDMSVAYYHMGKVYYKNVQELGVYDIAINSTKTLVKTYTHNVSVDEKDGGLKNSFNESLGYVYVVGEHLYMRAALCESITQTGKADCIVRLDDGIKIWD